MGMIKLPESSIDFFSKNYNEIFETGNLAEGEWAKKVEQIACEYTNSPYSVSANSNGAGLLALLNIYKSIYNKKTIFIQSNTMYGVKTISLTSGLNFVGCVDCSISTLMPSI